MNYGKYALLIENKRFNQEIVPINEAEQSEEGLNKVWNSDKPGDEYYNQFKQLANSIKSTKDKKQNWGTWTGPVTIKYDNGEPMLIVWHYRDANGKFKEDGVTWDKNKVDAFFKSKRSQTTAGDFKADAVKISDAIKNLFDEKGTAYSWWDSGSSDAKDSGLLAFDDEEILVSLWDKWKKQNNITTRLDAMKKSVDDDDKENANSIENACTQIRKKISGGISLSDEVTWRISTADGSVKPYKVDTDIG